MDQCLTRARRDDGTQHRTWQQRPAAQDVPTCTIWVPEPAAALGQKRPKPLPGRARVLPGACVRPAAGRQVPR